VFRSKGLASFAACCCCFCLYFNSSDDALEFKETLTSTLFSSHSLYLAFCLYRPNLCLFFKLFVLSLLPSPMRICETWRLFMVSSHFA